MAATTAPVATSYTYDFVRKALPPGARDVLEVGCGEGELAAQLVEDGFAVLAIDLDPQCVAAATQRGVAARQLGWPANLDRQFDAILFTRSLHHVHELGDAVLAARESLRAGGRLIVEEFHAEGTSVRSREWFRGLTRTLAASGAFTDSFDLQERLSAADPDEQHELHSVSAIEKALGGFRHVKSEDAAYYFRYLEGHLIRVGAASELLRYELNLIRSAAIDALGKRFVAGDTLFRIPRKTLNSS